ncbi:MAG: tetratricopeptide repeat protein [Deltaproteobacteria bacterium]|nr:MAG: tetratricopeptide repeat protein [Deltaproteobacteria bacterium]
MSPPREPVRSEIDRQLDAAESALERGDIERVLDLCTQVLEVDPGHPGAHFLLGDALRDLQEPEAAEEHYRAALRADPQHASSWSGLASVLFDQLRYEEARNAALRAIRADPGEPEGYYVRALLRERRGDEAGAQRDYRKAFRLDPEGYAPPTPMDDALVEAVVQQALMAMHPSIRAYLENVAILLEELPDDETCASFDPPASPAMLLGFFSGSSLMDRTTEGPFATLPATIVLFRRNLERMAADRDRLIEELQITVLHEVGHFLGLDEDDLEQRGLD